MAADRSNAVVTVGSSAKPDEKSFPSVPFSNLDFHYTCDIYDNCDPFQVCNCELVGLKDQFKEWVRDKLVGFLDHLVELGVAGFRVDAAKHMHPNNLKVIYSRVRNLNTYHGFPSNSRPFFFEEVIDHGGESISKYEYNELGAVTELRFSEQIGRAFSVGNDLKWLYNWGPAWGFLPFDSALVFVDNHVNQRDGYILSYKKAKQYKMATALALAYQYTISRIMSSFDFIVKDDDPPPDNADQSIKSPVFGADGSCINGWVCEHRWRQIYNMNEFKNVVRNSNTGVIDWWDNGTNQIAFCRENRGFIAFNGDSYDFKQKLQTCLEAGSYCNVIS